MKELREKVLHRIYQELFIYLTAMQRRIKDDELITLILDEVKKAIHDSSK